ncbi:hypothetical protein [Aquimarina gracilis]|uniref:hypothetical protein n=1 Tax=Aquimarina gracilis TaxID=874422 RepID=UPI0033701CF3
MKKALIFSVFIQFFFNGNQNNNSKVLVKDFINNIVFSQSYQDGDLEKYIKIYEVKGEEKSRLTDYISYFVSLTKEELINIDYDIISYEEVKGYPLLQEDEIYSKL